MDDILRGEHLVYPSDRLRQALEDPITLDLAHYTAGKIAPPTPLDLDGVFIDPSTDVDHGAGELPQSPVGRYTFRGYMLEDRTRMIAFMKDDGRIPEPLIRLLDEETYGQMVNRAYHNMAALGRLKSAVIERPPHDDLMLDIIVRARAGLASLPEMVRLLKEYPEMTSIETSNYRGTLDPEMHQRALEEAMRMLPYLRDNFHDARVTPGTDSSYSKSSLVPGVGVSKQVLADIESVDSHTQLVLKVPAIQLGETTLELGVTTYLRVFDRARQVDEPEIDIQDIIADLPVDEARRVLGEIAAKDLSDIN